MSGRTMFRKIVEKHLMGTLSDGSMVLSLDTVMGHDITPPIGINDMQARGIDEVFDPRRIKMMVDHVVPAGSFDSARQHSLVREWSRKHGVEFFDVGRGGICHRLALERALVRPGQVAIMPDSHTCAEGVLGAFTAGCGTTDWVAGVITGLFVCPPQKVVRVNLVGDLPPNVFSKDVVLELLRLTGPKGLTNCVVEFCGQVLKRWSVGARSTMTNMVIESGGTCGMMPIDEKTISYLWPVLIGEFAGYRSAFEHLSEWNSDSDVRPDDEITIDVSKLVPLAAVDNSPAKSVDVRVLGSKRVDQVLIASCTNGGIEDLRIAARIVRAMGGKIADNLRCVVIPATQKIWLQADEEGLLRTFAQAGCWVSGYTCGACLGMSCGVVTGEEVVVSTTNRNFDGRMSGGNGGEIILVSPATAAFTAVTGCVTMPSAAVCARLLRGVDIPEDMVKPSGWVGSKSVKRPDYTELLAKVAGAKPREFGGQAFYLPRANVNTDEIIPANQLNRLAKAEFGPFCFTGFRRQPLSAGEFERLRQSRVLVARENFGCGSSREMAPWALEANGINCVIAPSSARIFRGNTFANGMLCVDLPVESVDFLLQEQDPHISVDWEHGLVTTGCGREFQFKLTDHERNLVQSGGLVPVMIKMAAELQKADKL